MLHRCLSSKSGSSLWSLTEHSLHFISVYCFLIKFCRTWGSTDKADHCPLDNSFLYTGKLESCPCWCLVWLKGGSEPASNDLTLVLPRYCAAITRRENSTVWESKLRSFLHVFGSVLSGSFYLEESTINHRITITECQGMEGTLKAPLVQSLCQSRVA